MQYRQLPTAAQLIRAAIAAAGRGPIVQKSLGIGSKAISKWIAVGRIPAHHIKPLCELGGNAITPDQILDALAREASEKAAA